MVAMNADKPVHADNVPTPTGPFRGQVPPEEIARHAEKLLQERDRPNGSDEARQETESQLNGEAESRPVSGTASRPYVKEPAQPIRSKTKSRDSADAAVQTRSATEGKSKQSAGKLRNQ